MTELMPHTAPVENSPCRNICKLLVPHATLCSGCGRSKAEIANWSRMGDEERRTVKQRATKRLLECGLNS